MSEPVAGPEVRFVALDPFQDLLERQARRHEQHQRGERPLRFPFELLTKHMDELRAGSLTIVHGPPGGGKSSLAVQTAIECGYPALVVSTGGELGIDLVVVYAAAIATNTFKGKFLDPGTPPIQLGRYLDDFRRKAPRLALAASTRGADVTAPWLYEVALALRERFETDNALVVIDSLTGYARGIDGDDEYDRTNRAIDQLCEVGQRAGVAMLATVHRNRAGLSRAHMASAKGSSQIEFSADVQIALDPAECIEVGGRRHRSLPDGPKIVVAGMMKNRFGTLARVGLRFDGATGRFDELGYVDTEGVA